MEMYIILMLFMKARRKHRLKTIQVPFTSAKLIGDWGEAINYWDTGELMGKDSGLVPDYLWHAYI